jgi:membrane protein YdbS with pleckstrin-like domain
MSQEDAQQARPAGWYPDPAGRPVLREWNGTAWTAHEVALPQPSTSGERGLDQRVEGPRRMTSMSPASPANLVNDEHVLARTSLHWWAGYGLAIILGFAWLFFAVIDAAGPGASAFVQTFFLFAPIAALAAAVGFYRLRFTEFVLTNQRLSIKTGVVSRRSLEILLNKIEGVEVQQGILGRILGFGKLVFNGVGGTHERFVGVREPQAFRRLVQEQVASLHLS